MVVVVAVMVMMMLVVDGVDGVGENKSPWEVQGVETWRSKAGRMVAEVEITALQQEKERAIWGRKGRSGRQGPLSSMEQARTNEHGKRGEKGRCDHH